VFFCELPRSLDHLQEGYQEEQNTNHKKNNNNNNKEEWKSATSEGSGASNPFRFCVICGLPLAMPANC
jgi:hypothetical protein